MLTLVLRVIGWEDRERAGGKGEGKGEGEDEGEDEEPHGVIARLLLAVRYKRKLRYTYGFILSSITCALSYSGSIIDALSYLPSSSAPLSIKQRNQLARLLSPNPTLFVPVPSIGPHHQCPSFRNVFQGRAQRLPVKTVELQF